MSRAKSVFSTPLPSAYLFYGNETFLIDDAISQLQHKMFRSEDAAATGALEKIDGSQSTGYDVLDQLVSCGLFQRSEDRLVVVKQAQHLKDTDQLLKTLSNSTKPWGDSVLVLVTPSLDSRKKLHGYFKKSGTALEFTTPAPAERLHWVNQMAKKQKVRISPDAAELLTLCGDGSLYQISFELEKAILFASRNGELPVEISREDVASVVHQHLSFEMSELVKAFVEGKRARSLLLAHELIESSEDALGFVGYLTWALKNPDRFQFHRSWTLARMRNTVRALIEFDRRLKSSPLEPLAVVESFLLEQSPR